MEMEVKNPATALGQSEQWIQILARETWHANRDSKNLKRIMEMKVGRMFAALSLMIEAICVLCRYFARETAIYSYHFSAR